MSLLDDYNPIKLAKEGLHKAEDLGSSALHSVVDAGSSVVHKAEDLGSSAVHKLEDAGSAVLSVAKKPVELAGQAVTAVENVASSVINVNFGSLLGEIKAVGTDIVKNFHPLEAYYNGKAASELGTIVKNISLLALPLGPAAVATDYLVKLGEHLYESKDHKYTVHEVDDITKCEAGADMAFYLDAYDKANPKSSTERSAAPKVDLQHLDMSAKDLYPASGDKQKAERTSEQTTTKSREYINEQSQHAEVSVKPGEVSYTATKDGHVEVKASQTKDGSRIESGAGTATTDGQNMHFENGQVKVDSTKDGQHVDDGQFVVDNNKKAQIIRMIAGVLPTELRKRMLGIGDAVQIMGDNREMQEAIRSASANDKIQVFVGPNQDKLMVLPDGSKIMMRPDGTAMIKPASGAAPFMVTSDNKTLVWRDGGFHELNDNDRFNGVEGNNETIRVGRIEIGRHNGHIHFQHNGKRADVDVRSGRVVTNNNDGKGDHEVEGSNTKPTTIRSQGQTIIVHGTTAVIKGAAGGPDATVDMEHQTITTPHTIVHTDKVEVPQHDGKPPVVISGDKIVLGKDLVLHRDGSMQLDEQTFVDSSGRVTSGNWSASSDLRSDSSMGESSSGIQGVLQQNVQATTVTANSAAMEIYGKASAGIVTFADIGKLNQNVTDICGLMSLLSAAGATDLVGQLQTTLGTITDAISFATPKAQAAEVAIRSGESSPFILKQIEDSTGGRSPEQAAQAVLAHAA